MNAFVHTRVCMKSHVKLIGGGGRMVCACVAERWCANSFPFYHTVHTRTTCLWSYSACVSTCFTRLPHTGVHTVLQ